MESLSYNVRFVITDRKIVLTFKTVIGSHIAIRYIDYEFACHSKTFKHFTEPQIFLAPMPVNVVIHILKTKHV